MLEVVELPPMIARRYQPDNNRVFTKKRSALMKAAEIAKEQSHIYKTLSDYFFNEYEREKHEIDPCLVLDVNGKPLVD